MVDSIDVMVFVRYKQGINIFEYHIWETVWFGEYCLLTIMPEYIYRKTRLSIINHPEQHIFTEIQLIKPKR